MIKDQFQTSTGQGDTVIDNTYYIHSFSHSKV